MYLMGREIKLDVFHSHVSQQMQDDIALAINTGQPFALKGKNASVIFDPANKRSLKIGGLFNLSNSITTYPGEEEMYAAISLNLFGKKEFIPAKKLIETGAIKLLEK